MAIGAASVKACKSLLDALISDWNKLINDGAPLSVTVNAVTTFRDKNSVINTLKNLTGIVNVYERSWDGESKTLQIDVQYKGNANGFCSKLDGFKLSQGGSFAVTGQSGAKITLVLQSK